MDLCTISPNLYVYENHISYVELNLELTALGGAHWFRRLWKFNQIFTVVNSINNEYIFFSNQRGYREYEYFVVTIPV